jgi:hypothetical protein
VNYVEDRDLWRFKLPWSKAINAYLGAIPFDFERWSDLGRHDTKDLETLIVPLGLAVEDKIAQYVAEVRKNAIFVDLQWAAPRREAVSVPGADTDAPRERVYFRKRGVPLVNAAQADISELLGSFIEKPGDIALGWFQRADGLFQYSVRSYPCLVPEAADIAKYHGGGGHAQAAGFQCRVPPPWHVPAPRHG